VVLFLGRQGAHPFLQCRSGGKVKMLLYINDAVIFRYDHRAGIRLLLTVDHLKKGGFAMSVLTNQANPLFGCEGKTDLIQKKPVTEAFRQIFYSDHKKYAQSAKNCDGKYCLNFSI
jgi:hypothetical protein